MNATNSTIYPSCPNNFNLTRTVLIGTIVAVVVAIKSALLTYFVCRQIDREPIVREIEIVATRATNGAASV